MRFDLHCHTTASDGVQSPADLVRRGQADAAAFGRDFIATPDLPHRLREGLALNAQDPATFSAGGPKGYVDYPVAEEVA